MELPFLQLLHAPARFIRSNAHRDPLVAPSSAPSPSSATKHPTANEALLRYTVDRVADGSAAFIKLKEYTVRWAASQHSREGWEWSGPERMPGWDDTQEIRGTSEADIASYLQYFVLRQACWLVRGYTGLEMDWGTPWPPPQTGAADLAVAANGQGYRDVLFEVKPENILTAMLRLFFHTKAVGGSGFRPATKFLQLESAVPLPLSLDGLSLAARSSPSSSPSLSPPSLSPPSLSPPSLSPPSLSPPSQLAAPPSVHAAGRPRRSASPVHLQQQAVRAHNNSVADRAIAQAKRPLSESRRPRLGDWAAFGWHALGGEPTAWAEKGKEEETATLLQHQIFAQLAVKERTAEQWNNMLKKAPHPRPPPLHPQQQPLFLMSEGSAIPTFRVGVTQYYGPDAPTVGDMRTWVAVFLLLAVEDLMGENAPGSREFLLARLGESISSASTTSAATPTPTSSIPSASSATAGSSSAASSSTASANTLSSLHASVPLAPLFANTATIPSPVRPLVQRRASDASDTTVSADNSFSSTSGTVETSFEVEKGPEEGQERVELEAVWRAGRVRVLGAKGEVVWRREPFNIDLELPRFEHGCTVTINLGELLGEGATGRVLSDRGGALALKFVEPMDTLPNNFAFEDRLYEIQNEAEVLSEMRGAGGAPLWGGAFVPESWEGAGMLLITERVVGETCCDWVDVVPVAEAAYAALTSLHSTGYVHCDIHPSNFVIRPQGAGVVLLDYGRAFPIETERDVVLERVAFLSEVRQHCSAERFKAILENVGVRDIWS